MVSSTVPVTTPARPTAGGRLRSLTWPWQLLSLGAVVGVWALAVSTGFAPRSAFSTPSAVAGWMRGWVSDGSAWSDIGATMEAALLGYAIGIVAGLVVAAVFVFVAGVAAVLEPYMSLLNSVPLVVIAPLFVLVLGTGTQSKMALAAIIVFFLAFFSLYNGLRSVDQNLINHARVLGAGPVRLATIVYIPAILSWVMSTMRVGIGFALVGVVVGEFVGGNHGLGAQINLGQQLNQPNRTVGGIIALALIAAIIDWALSRLEAHFAQWQVF